jgi:cadmium resistance protein CadD (predicted permease)
MTNKSSSNKVSKSKTAVEPTNPLEKYLAFGFLGSVVISILSVLVILLAPLVSSTWVPQGWGMIPILLLPFGFVCLIGLLVVNAASRKKSSQTK